MKHLFVGQNVGSKCLIYRSNMGTYLNAKLTEVVNKENMFSQHDVGRKS